MKFLPDGRLLVSELQGKIRVLAPPYTSVDPNPFLQITNIGVAGVQQGIYDFVLDPNFGVNHYYYVFYTLGIAEPRPGVALHGQRAAQRHGAGQRARALRGHAGRRRRAPRRRAELRQRRQALLHDRRALRSRRPRRTSRNPRGKIHRINPDGTVPTDNPFYDGAGPNYDSVWALGLRNPYRAYYDAADGSADHRRRRRQRRLDGDRGGRTSAPAAPTTAGPTSKARAARRARARSTRTPHNGRDSAVTGGFVYHGDQFPSELQGQLLLRRLHAELDQAPDVRSRTATSRGVLNFEPSDGRNDGPYGDIVYLVEGPEGALYYLDLGYSDISGTFGVSKLRRIRYISGDQPPIGVGGGQPAVGPGAADGQLLERGLERPGGQAADLQLDVRRRADLDAGQPDPHLPAAGHVLGAADGLRRDEHDAVDAAHDHGRQPADGDRS